MTHAEPAAAIRPITDVAEAELAMTHLLDVMEALLIAVEKETDLVRAGRMSEAAGLEPGKAELSRLYVSTATRLQASQTFMARAMPDVLAALRRRHDQFQALLQINLTVLATAHAVAESIMRGVSDELARKAVPQGYGASGNAIAPPNRHAQPLTVSRVL